MSAHQCPPPAPSQSIGTNGVGTRDKQLNIGTVLMLSGCLVTLVMTELPGLKPFFFTFITDVMPWHKLSTVLLLNLPQCLNQKQWSVWQNIRMARLAQTNGPSSPVACLPTVARARCPRGNEQNWATLGPASVIHSQLPANRG